MRFEDALTLIGTASSLTVKETVSRDGRCFEETVS